MIKPGELVETKQSIEAQKQWQSLLTIGENISVIFPYLSDRQFRIFQWTQRLKQSHLFPIILNFSQRSFDESIDFENYITSLLPKEWDVKDLNTLVSETSKNLVLIVIDGESLNKPENYKALSLLQTILLTYTDRIQSFIAFESDIYQLMDTTTKYNKLFQNILYYPLYQDEDMSIFVDYLCQKWDIKIPSPIRKQIIAFSGGSFWLAKEACRGMRDTHVWNKHNHNLEFRLSQIAKTFSEKETVILSSLPQTKSYKHGAEYNHLKKCGFITSTEKLRIPALASKLSAIINLGANLEIKNDEVFLHGVLLTQVLSPIEFSLLKHFLSKPNVPVSRDEIASVMWPNNTEEYYSPWAIDQAIKRLRDRLISLRLPPTIISSVRGVGYEYRAA